MTAKKLDKEHVDSITNLREQFQQNTLEIGSVSIELQFLETQKSSLEQRKTTLMNQFVQLREQETALIDSLKERYGDGSINITDGTFTPYETGQE